MTSRASGSGPSGKDVAAEDERDLELDHDRGGVRQPHRVARAVAAASEHPAGDGAPDSGLPLQPGAAEPELPSDDRLVEDRNQAVLDVIALGEGAGTELLRQRGQLVSATPGVGEDRCGPIRIDVTAHCAASDRELSNARPGVAVGDAGSRAPHPTGASSSSGTRDRGSPASAGTPGSGAGGRSGGWMIPMDMSSLNASSVVRSTSRTRERSMITR